MAADGGEEIETGTLILTGNERLAAALRARDADARRAAGAGAWEPPPVFSFDHWLRREWQRTLLFGPARRGLLLSAAQEQLVWEQILTADDTPLLDPAATARAAAEAYALLHAWQLPRDTTEWGQSEDTEAFGGWTREFETRCRELDWLPAAWLTSVIEFTAPPRLEHAGFDELTPEQQALFDRLGSRPLDAPAHRSTPTLYAAPDPESEWRAAAAWARQQLESGAGSIAIVAPALHGARATAERILTEALHPGREPWDTTPRAFNLSLGLPLAAYPLVEAALLILDTSRIAAAGEFQPWSTVSQLLRTPFLRGHARAREERARLEVKLRGKGLTRLRLKQLASHEGAPPLQRWLQALPNADAPACYRDWSQSIAVLLDAVGWPGDFALDSAEHQTQLAWNELLDELAGLDQVSAPVTFSAAVARMRQLATGRIFQPQSAAAPVQVLGWLEAAGMEWDALWVLGLDDDTAPAKPAPNPFLPWELQRRHRLPHSSAEREAQFAQRRLDGLRDSAPVVVFSYAFRPADGDFELRPSPLLEMLARTPPLPALNPAVTRPVFDPFADLPVPAGAAERGGNARVFEDQSACAFRAFVHHRLQAPAPEKVGWALSHMARGSLLHDALARFWKQCAGHAALSALSTAQLEDSIAICTRGAVDACRGLDSLPWLREAEIQRLNEALLRWLAYERQRPPFEVIACEQEADPEFAGLELHLRLDRIDQIDGNTLLIDYKSGRVNPAGWETERMDAPQLPLYAVSAGVTPAPIAVAFATLKPGEETLVGRGAGFKAVPWPRQIEAWRADLAHMAADYLSGHALVNRKRPSSCKDCDLPTLCRIHEGLPDPAGADGPGAEDDDE